MPVYELNVATVEGMAFLNGVQFELCLSLLQWYVRVLALVHDVKE